MVWARFVLFDLFESFGAQSVPSYAKFGVPLDSVRHVDREEGMSYRSAVLKDGTDKRGVNP